MKKTTIALSLGLTIMVGILIISMGNAMKEVSAQQPVAQTPCEDRGFPPTELTGNGDGDSFYNFGDSFSWGDVWEIVCPFGLDEEAMEDEATSEALSACNQDLQTQIAAKGAECDTICSTGTPVCGSSFTVSITQACTATCSWSTYGPVASHCGLPNYVSCDAVGKAKVECSCTGAVLV